MLDDPITFAHRGACAYAPENTLEAFALGLRLGATGLESDVWLTADGVAYTCLFAASGFDLKPWLRPSLDPEGLDRALRSLWRQRRDRYSEERSMALAAGSAAKNRLAHAEMAYLGG